MTQSQNNTTALDDLLTTILRAAAFDLTYSIHKDTVLTVTFCGADVPHLLARNAELLLALEHVAAKALRLEPEEHDRISFDAGNFKGDRQKALERTAQAAVMAVRQTGRAFHFLAMNSRERRMLHLALAGSGFLTQSEGDGAQRHLVLRPESPERPATAPFVRSGLPGI